ncbi:SigB/SigF/SigG family RNA polymerase sigma factor [Peptoniphilaceae bacterium SGI.131]
MQNNKVSEKNKISSAELFKELEVLKEKEKGLDKEELKLLRFEIKQIRDILIERHLYIAEILAKKYINKGIEYDDLYQVASLGLILALDRFNIDKGYEFSSYATPTIVGEIKRYFRDKGWVIRVPRRIQELSKKINAAKIELSQSLQTSPSIDQIADYLDVSSEEVIEAMDASQVYTPQSLDRSIDNSSDDKELNIGDLLGVEDKNYESIEIMDFVKDIMNQLNEIERKIVVYRYFERMTQIAIAEKLQISQMTVSRMEKKVIKKFRKELEKI